MSKASRPPWQEIPKTIPSKDGARDLSDDMKRRFGINHIYRAWELKCVLDSDERVVFVGRLAQLNYQDAQGNRSKYGFKGSASTGLFVVTDSRLILSGPYGWAPFALASLQAPGPVEHGTFGFSTSSGEHLDVSTAMWLIKPERADQMRQALISQLDDTGGEFT